jgi:hypothetical protein
MNLQTLEEAIREKVSTALGPGQHFRWYEELARSQHQRVLDVPCECCGQRTFVCCHVDVGDSGPDHLDQFCHVCLNPYCSYGEMRQQTVAFSMSTKHDRCCWLCGRDVYEA